ncbi:MAG: hypothetical protein ABI776_09270 [Nocardioidaceae bacterium]
MGDQVRVLAGIGGTVTGFGEADCDGLVPVVTAPGVLKGLACHAEEPGARLLTKRSRSTYAAS